MPINSTTRWAPQDDYLRAHYPGSSTKAIAQALGRTEKQVQQRAFELGVKKSKAAKGRSTDRWIVLDEVIQLIYADMHNDALSEFLGISTVDLISRAGYLRLKKSKKIMREVVKKRAANLPRDAQFQPGLVPWNKGMKGFDPVLGRGLYKPGTTAPHAAPIGALRTRTCPVGAHATRLYLEKKTADPGVWERVHRLVWEAENGPVPDGHIVVFRPGCHSVVESEITTDKLECITRAALANRNHPMNHTPEMVGLYQLRSAITRQVNRITKEQTNDHTPHQRAA